MDIIGHFINGKIINDAARTQAVYNPSTGQVSQQVAIASRSTVEQAIAVATAAFPSWRDTPVIKRARVMFKFKELLEKNADKHYEEIGLGIDFTARDLQSKLKKKGHKVGKLKFKSFVNSINLKQYKITHNLGGHVEKSTARRRRVTTGKPGC